MHTIKNYAKMFRSRPLRFALPVAKQHQREPPAPSIWNSLKKIASKFSSSSIEHYLKKHQSTGYIIDSVTADSKFWLNFESNYKVENLVKMKKSSCRAYHLEDSSIYCVPEKLGSLGCETPRVNDTKSAGKNYRFFYAISSDVDAQIPGTVRHLSTLLNKTNSFEFEIFPFHLVQLIKVDADNKTMLTWNEKNVYPSEPIFVPAPNAKVIYLVFTTISLIQCLALKLMLQYYNFFISSSS